MQLLRRFGPPTAFGILLFLVGIFLSVYYQWYLTYWFFDKVMHTLGGLAVAWFAARLFMDNAETLHSAKFVLILVAAAVLIGTFWEFLEFYAGASQNTHPLLYRYMRGGDHLDTLFDLALDMFGAVLYAIIHFAGCMKLRRRAETATAAIPSRLELD